MNDEPTFFSSKPLRVALLFVAFSLIAAAVPSPWWDGKLLEVLPDLPSSLQPDIGENEIVAESPAPRVALPPAADRPEDASRTRDENTANPVEPTTNEAETARPEDDGAQAPAEPRMLALRDAIAELVTALGERPTYWEVPCIAFDEGARQQPENRVGAGVSGATEEIRPMLGPRLPAEAVAAGPQQARSERSVVSDEPRARPSRQLAGPRRCTQWALDRFYARLTRVALGEAGELARISQYGDSLVVGDEFTGELRRLLQEQFGDGGHGFVYIGNPLRNFGYENIRLGVDSNWSVRTVVRHSSAGGGLFGLAGAEFRIRSGSSLSIQSEREAPGNALEHLRLLYFAGPENDELTFGLSVDGERREETVVLEPGASGTFDLQLPRGEHRVSFYGFRHNVRMYGVISETSGPGVVVDNLGLVSARARHLLKIHPEHWQDQLTIRSPDLVSFFYGVNAAGTTAARFEADAATYTEEYIDVLKRATGDNALRDCMVMSVLTRGSREGGHVHEMSAVTPMARAQREAAIGGGCAFFDTHAMLEASGGARRWNRARPQLLGPDLSHPTSTGYDEIARRVYIALMHGYLDYLTRRLDGQLDITGENLP